VGRKKGMMLNSGSDEEDSGEGKEEKDLKTRSRVRKVEASKEEPGSCRKGKILRCADSSDDERAIPVPTPKAERMKRLEEMRSKRNAKKSKRKVRYSSSSGSSDDQGPGDAADEENLPMWENEEAPPENAKVFVEDPDEKEDSNLQDFVVSDGNEEADMEAGRLPDSEDSETEKAATRKKRSGRRKGNLGDLNHSDSEASDNIEAASSKAASRRTRSSVKEKVNSKERKRGKKAKALISDTEDGSSPSEETEDETEYVNPYMVEDKNDLGATLARLRRDTANDRRNKKNYKREVGKYQFECHTSRNKAAKMDERVRFARTMETAKFDQGLKEDRNLDWGDSEFYEYKEANLYGQAFRLYPHTRRITKYSSRCAVSGCCERFQAGESKVIGAMQLDPFSFRFVKKTSNWTGKECFYYVCAEHYPKGEDSSDEDYPSGASDDQMDDASEDEKIKKGLRKQKKVSAEDEEGSDRSESE